MSEEQLKAFLEKVQSDTSLQEKLKGAADPEAVAAIAKEVGFSISADDLTKARSEIEDKELEAAAGGAACRGNLCILSLHLGTYNPNYTRVKLGQTCKG